MLQVRNLAKTFGSGDTEVKAVDGVSFTVPTGVFAAVVGRSGSGKSTLLSLLGALDKRSAGTIEVDGEVISRGSDHQLIRYRRNQIGFVFQSYNLIPNLSALQNVMLPMEFAGVSRAERRARGQALLDQVGLKGAKQQRRPAVPATAVSQNHCRALFVVVGICFDGLARWSLWEATRGAISGSSKAASS